MTGTRSRAPLKAFAGTCALLALAACSPEPTEYKADVKDESGGELIVKDVDATSVPVTVPDTPMTNVPPAEK